MVEKYANLSLVLAELIREQLQAKPDSCLGLPTGRTPLGCYQILSTWSANNQLDWSQARCFQLDDYIDVQEEFSFHQYLQDNLYRFTNVNPKNTFNPRHIADYDEQIASLGGLDLAILGIGLNGHIAFNEPGTPVASWTHSMFLTEATRDANSEFFPDENEIPTRAVTMGIQTILGSRRLVLVASGESKRDILEMALHGAVTVDVPASFLQKHDNLLVLTDFDINTEQLRAEP